MHQVKRKRSPIDGYKDVLRGSTSSDKARAIGSETGRKSEAVTEPSDTTLGRSERTTERTCRPPNHSDKKMLNIMKGPTTIDTSQDSEASSEDEDEQEDDDGLLDTDLLDAEYMATLRAVQQRDPKLYDQSAIFYTPHDSSTAIVDRAQESKSISLHEYHRNNLLNHAQSSGVEEGSSSYQQEQDRAKEELLEQIHAAKEANTAIEIGGSLFDDDEEDMFQAKKPLNTPQPEAKISTNDVKVVDTDPETFLSRFLETRAWIPHESMSTHKFESDDEDDDKAAEDFEQAYNLRFEDSAGANERIVTHSRDAITKFSVRAKPETRRQRLREADKVVKEEAKLDRLKRKSALKKLRMEEAEAKIRQINETAGIESDKIGAEGWADFLAADWNEKDWELKMTNKFGEDYYTLVEDDPQASHKLSDHLQPTWESEIDIAGIDPSTGDDTARSLSFEAGDEYDKRIGNVRDDVVDRTHQHRESKHGKNQSRLSKRHIEQFVDKQIGIEDALNTASKGDNGDFRYRETSPLSFGLTARDILMASDTQLNQFAGLRKIAAFRDADKRNKDKKRLGKKARLRMWRKETFGDEQGSQTSLQDLLHEEVQSESINLREKNGAGTSRALEQAINRG